MCGCPDCRHQPVPQTRAGWKSRRNKHGEIFGLHRKPKKAKKSGA